MTNPNPGTPWMHLLALLMRKSMPSAAMSMGTPPKLLMASTMNVLPWRLTTSATAASGLSTPVVVSQWTTDTWVTSGCSFR